MSQTGSYRYVRSRLWLNPPFVDLAEAEKLVALYLLTGPQTNSLGLYKLSPGTAAEELHLTKNAWSKRFLVVQRAFEWHYDERVRVLWIPDWITENPPRNPNVVRFWRRQFDEINEAAMAQVRRAIRDARWTFVERCAKLLVPVLSLLVALAALLLN